MRVAVVDLGTNSVRLLLGEVREGRVESAVRRTIVTRLGQGVDRRRRLDPEAVLRTRACLAGFAAEIESYAPERRLLIATSALRDATDERGFLEAVQDDFRLPWQVLSGEEEAALAFAGAASSSPPIDGDVVVIDIGGGSTEFAVGATASTSLRPRFVCSLDVGVVRVTERFLAGDPPTAQEWNAASAFVREELKREVPAEARAGVNGGIGLAGTFTTLVAHKLALATYDPTLVHGHLLSLAEIEAAGVAFRGMTSAQRAALPGIQRGREDVIPAGTLVAAESCRLFGLDVLYVSEADILDGAALLVAGLA